jgi:1-deoxy-D-xylulose-5-phosphate reductoisomerase
VFNAANEVAVARFLAGEIEFLAIEDAIESVVDRHVAIAAPSLEQIEDADSWARTAAQQFGR